ncbi:MAG: hypothetical protein H6944_15930 [Zoogloeaceae bacterium]|nr:hypothetical protein [Zoogloeaceae bacterium]
MFELVDDAGWYLVTVRSADEAWELLDLATHGGAIPEKLRIKFEGWPTFTMKVDGKDWKSTVPTRVMGPLLELQKDLHRNFVSISYGTANLKKLRDEDRDSLEIVVKVADGSSDFLADLAKQMTVLGEKALDKMSSRDAVVAVVGVATIVGTSLVAMNWIATRQHEIDAETKIELSRQETERLKIMKDAVTAQPRLQEAQKDHVQTTNRLLKTLKPSDSASVMGVQISGPEAMEITQQDRARSQDVELSGAFRVLANDASRGDGFRIKVARLSDGLTFSADVPFELPADQKKLIQEAEWSKGSEIVELHVEGLLLRGAVQSARVLSASIPE